MAAEQEEQGAGAAEGAGALATGCPHCGSGGAATAHVARGAKLGAAARPSTSCGAGQRQPALPLAQALPLQHRRRPAPGAQARSVARDGGSPLPGGSLYSLSRWRAAAATKHGGAKPAAATNRRCPPGSPVTSTRGGAAKAGRATSSRGARSQAKAKAARWSGSGSLVLAGAPRASSPLALAGAPADRFVCPPASDGDAGAAMPAAPGAATSAAAGAADEGAGREREQAQPLEQMVAMQENLTQLRTGPAGAAPAPMRHLGSAMAARAPARGGAGVLPSVPSPRRQQQQQRPHTSSAGSCW